MPDIEPRTVPDTPPGAPLLTVADGCATLMLNRPDHHNRLHRADLLALQSHLRALQADPGVRLLVLTGAGRTFCSGYHLGELGDGTAQGGPELFEQTVDALEALPLPTICRFNGGVHGGATDLALACDFRVGVHGMALRMPAARLGLHYYPSGLRRYVTRLGLANAKRLFLLADEVNADELLRIGYLDRLVAPDRLDAEVHALAAVLSAGAPLALRGMKCSLNEIARGDADPATLRARVAQCAASADLREGMAAFAEHRAPRFVGR